MQILERGDGEPSVGRRLELPAPRSRPIPARRWPPSPRSPGSAAAPSSTPATSSAGRRASKRANRPASPH